MNTIKYAPIAEHTVDGKQNPEVFEIMNTLPTTKDMQKMKASFVTIFSHYLSTHGSTKKGNDISDNILGDSMSEIALYIMQKDFEKAKYLWNIIVSIDSLIKHSDNLEPIAKIFEDVRNKKLGRNGVEKHTLQEGENRLTIVKSAIDELELE